MGTIAEKLAYTKQAREEIIDAILAKGVECPRTAPFRTFDDYIAQISGGGEPSYRLVSNGLVAFFNAKQNSRKGFDVNATTWEDLSGNRYDADLVGTLPVNAWSNDAFTSDGKAYFKIRKETIPSDLFVGNTPFTVQVQYLYDKATSNKAFFSFGKNSSNQWVSTWYNATNRLNTSFYGFDFNQYIYNLGYEYILTVTYDCAKVRYFLDSGILGEAARTSRNGVLNDIYLLSTCIDPTMALPLPVYAIAIYNRALEPEEIRQNMYYLYITNKKTPITPVPTPVPTPVITYTALIPILTDNTNVLSSSSWVYSGIGHPYQAFNDDATTYWTGNGSTGQYIGYDFGVDTDVSKYSVTARNRYSDDLNYTLTGWQLEGYNAATQEWIVIDTQNNVSFTRGETKEFEIVTVTYSAYRIYVLTCPSSSYVSVGDFQVYSSNKWRMPILSSNTQEIDGITYNITADSSINNSMLPWLAFDGIDASTLATQGKSWHSAKASQYGAHWLMLNMSKEIAITSFTIKHRYTANTNENHNLKEFVFEGSTDGSTWTELLHGTCVGTPATSETFNIEKYAYYTYYRLRELSTYSIYSYEVYLVIGELIFEGIIKI